MEKIRTPVKKVEVISPGDLIWCYFADVVYYSNLKNFNCNLNNHEQDLWRKAEAPKNCSFLSFLSWLVVQIGASRVIWDLQNLEFQIAQRRERSVHEIPLRPFIFHSLGLCLRPIYQAAHITERTKGKSNSSQIGRPRENYHRLRR